MFRTLTGYVIVAGLLPATLAGQDIRALRERVTREAQLARTAALVLIELRSIDSRTRSSTDTVVIANGNITVVSHADVAPLVRAAAAQADSILRQVTPRLASLHGTLVYVENDSVSVYSREKRSGVTVYYSAPPHRSPHRLESTSDAEQIARLIESTAASRFVAIDRLLPMYEWRKTNYPLRKEDLREPDWGDVRFEILESPSLLGPRCYRGDVISCSMLLGLSPVEDPVMMWYDSLTRVRTVADHRDRAVRLDRAATEACERGDDKACGRLLYRISQYREAPSGAYARDALVWEALRIGGEGAIGRLLSSRGQPAEALAVAAGVPVDSVVRAWQRHVREGALASDDLTVVTTLVAIGWVVVLLFVTTRISRWR